MVAVGHHLHLRMRRLADSLRVWQGDPKSNGFGKKCCSFQLVGGFRTAAVSYFFFGGGGWVYTCCARIHLDPSFTRRWFKILVHLHWEFKVQIPTTQNTFVECRVCTFVHLGHLMLKPV